MSSAVQILSADYAMSAVGRRERRTGCVKTLEMEVSDHQFFEQSVTRLMDRMYGTAMRFTRNSTDAEDLMSECFEKAWNNLSKLESRDKFDGWIMRILSNTYISKWRHQQVHNKIFEDESEADDLDDKHSLYARLHQPFLLWWGTPEQAFLNNLLKEDIDRAMDQLPDGYRIVVLLVQILGYSYEEAAVELDVPVGTVRSRLNRGRKQLQEALWHHAKDAEQDSVN